MRRPLGFLMALAAVAAGGCSSASSGGGSDDDVPFTVQTAMIQVPPTKPALTMGAENLLLTPAIRRELLLARAHATHLRDDAFTSLYKGSAYYAIDHATGIYWAAGSTVADRGYLRAEVMTQDEGAYTIFRRKPGGEWTVYDAGRDSAEARSGAQCPIQIPADVLEVWHWAPNTCDPPLGPE